MRTAVLQSDQVALEDRAAAVIVRRRLIECIDVPYLAPVTLVTAPAGYGKSTLARQWADHAQYPVAWVSLDPASNNPGRFLAGLAAAIDDAVDDQNPLTGSDVTVDAILARVWGLAESGRPLSLLLDDYHHIENGDVHQAMDALIAHLPPAVRLLVFSRTAPPLSLGRLRVQGRVREITEADLRFTRDEAEAVIAIDGSDRFSRDQIVRLVERTDGWIAGLRLALLALDGLPQEQIDPFIEALAEHQWLDDYVVEEVLDTLPEELRAFVLRTAGLGPLDPDLCNAVLAREDSAALIDETARRLVFTRRDNRSGGTLTYHALFGECVARIARRLLSADELMDRHRRAAEWFERRGQLEAAIEHALNGEDLEMVVRLSKGILRGLMDIDWSHSAVYWLRRLPDAVVAGDPELAYWFVYAQFLIGHAREARQMLDRVEHRWRESGDSVQQGRALACHIYSLVLRGDSSAAELQELRHQALALLPDELAVERLHLWGGIAAEAYFHGDDDVGEEAYRNAEMYAARLPSEQNYWLIVNTIQRPNRAALRGNLPVAIALYERALELVPARLRYWAGSYHHRLATIHLERDDLETARAEAGHYEPDLLTSPWESWHSEAWITSAQIERATGGVETAYALLDRSIASAEEAGVTRLADHARALQASWWLVDGELDLARGWDQTTPVAQLDWGRTYGQMHGQLTRIQLHAAEGDFGAACALARELIADGERLKRWADVIPFYAWEVAALHRLGDEAAALEALRAALGIGMPGGFVRSFFPPGTDLRPLLAVARDQLPADEAAYAGALLAFGGAGAGQSTARVRSPGAPLPAARAALNSPLSRRETEVLGLLGGGHANREIARALYLSEPTVKMHVRNVLAKLGVRNRTAAVVRARELGLMSDGDDGATP